MTGNHGFQTAGAPPEGGLDSPPMLAASVAGSVPPKSPTTTVAGPDGSSPAAAAVPGLHQTSRPRSSSSPVSVARSAGLIAEAGSAHSTTWDRRVFAPLTARAPRGKHPRRRPYRR